jgi:hypothetical protein
VKIDSDINAKTHRIGKLLIASHLFVLPLALALTN